MRMMRKSQRLSFQNSTDADIEVVLEPWASEVVLNPGSVMDLIIIYKFEGSPHMNFRERVIDIWLWKSCTCRIFVDNVEVTDSGLEIPSP